MREKIRKSIGEVAKYPIFYIEKQFSEKIKKKSHSHCAMNLKCWTTPLLLEFLRINLVMNTKTEWKSIEYISVGIWIIPELVKKALCHAKLFRKSYFSSDSKDYRSLFPMFASFISSVSPLMNMVKPSSFFLISEAKSGFNIISYDSNKFEHLVGGTISRLNSTLNYCVQQGMKFI